LVSPAYKGGYSVTVVGLSEDGLSKGSPQVLANSTGSFAHLEHISPLAQRYKFSRVSTSWETTPLEFPQFSVYTTEGISPDFRSTLENTIIFAGAPPHEEDFFIRKIYLGLPDGSLVPMGPQEAPTAEGVGLLPLGASEDLRRVVSVIKSPIANSEETSALWPGDTTAAGRLPSLYEYEYTGREAGEPRLVGVSNVGEPASVGAGHLISDCGISLGSFPSLRGDAYNAISASGSVVFFTAAACSAPGPLVDEVYARLRATPTTRAHTVAVSEPNPSDCGECDTSNKAAAQFRGASLDGSKVFFTTEQRLLPSATGVGPYLYEYDFNGLEGKKIMLLSSGNAAGPRVQGVSRVSEDGSHVYFVAKGVLAGANAGHQSPIEGGDNLYVFEHDAEQPAGRVAFVSTLVGGDGADWSLQDTHPAQATPDGRFLVFQSTAHLTPDQEGWAGEEAGQVFEYDAETETLVRMSRGQRGYNKDGNSSEYAATVPVQAYERETPVGIGRVKGLAVSEDGSRVFFSSRDALTPQALNGVTNIYEYHDGQVGLISSGHDVVVTEGYPAVELVGTDESGRDVFFRTADRLLPRDTDNQVDLYDARVEGGFTLPAPLAPCSGDSCQGAPSPSPQLPAPGTSPAPEEASAPSGSPKKTKPKQKPSMHRRKAKRRGGKKHNKSGKTSGRRK
jgi:hypothetical protein